MSFPHSLPLGKVHVSLNVMTSYIYVLSLILYISLKKLQIKERYGILRFNFICLYKIKCKNCFGDPASYDWLEVEQMFDGMTMTLVLWYYSK